MAPSIQKEDRKYLRAIGLNYSGGDIFAARYMKKTMNKFRHLLPEGYEWEFKTKVVLEEKEEEKVSSMLLLCVLFLEIFFVCAILFNSIRTPLWIVLTIPFSFIGVMLPFSLWGFTFDQGGYVSFIFLGGLVVNATIYVVTQYFEERKRGRGLYMSLMKSVWIKSFTIFVTLISTIIGLLPFVLGSRKIPFWYSFSIGTIGGLLFSMVVIFFLLPIIICPKTK
ncbi:efflux RND transporter permease subunit [Halosquirtibacter xylanolyticus]|nr:efflux RND transporter permease subunit [Prolixibacteraceae bacterium]